MFSRTAEKSNPGEIRIKPNQPAAKFPQIPERTFNQEVLSFLLILLDILLPFPGKTGVIQNVYDPVAVAVITLSVRPTIPPARVNFVIN